MALIQDHETIEISGDTGSLTGLATFEVTEEYTELFELEIESLILDRDQVALVCGETALERLEDARA